MASAKPYSTPCAFGSKLSKYQGDPLKDAAEYRHIVGALHYCTLTRRDIAYSVNQLCQFLQSPTTTHLSTAKRVLRYLNCTTNFWPSLHQGTSTTLMGFVTVTRHVVQMIVNLSLVMVCILAHALFLGLLRNN